MPVGQRYLRVVFEVAGLLLAEPRAEVHRSVLHDADQLGHVRPTVGPHGGEPVQLGVLEDLRDVRPRRRAGSGSLKRLSILAVGT